MLLQSTEKNGNIAPKEVTIHSGPEQWPSEKKTSAPKINPNESVLQLYIDV